MRDQKPATVLCKDCRFWAHIDSVQGECRRHAPRARLVEAENYAGTSVYADFPITEDHQWCGEGAAPGPREILRGA